MTFFFLEVPLQIIFEDERYPDRDTRLVYQHLKYFCSLPSQFPLSAIDVRLVGGGFVVTGKHKYLKIARELSHPWIRASITCESEDAGDLLKELPPGIRIIPREELEREVAITVVRGYHVYFFENPLTEVAQRRFVCEIAEFFEHLETPLISRSERRLLNWAFPFEARCAQFEALIPVGDSSWFKAYRNTSREFSRSVQRIVSFQGALFLE